MAEILQTTFFKCNFFQKNKNILLDPSLKFVPVGVIYNAGLDIFHCLTARGKLNSLEVDMGKFSFK